VLRRPPFFSPLDFGDGGFFPCEFEPSLAISLEGRMVLIHAGVNVFRS